MAERPDLSDPDYVLGGHEDLIRRVLQDQDKLIAAEAVLGGDYWGPLIPGPWQTAAYTRAIWARAGILHSSLIEEAIRINERRAHVLRTHTAPRRVLLTQQSLTTDHPLDQNQIKHQRAHLAKLSAYEHVQVRVVNDQAHFFSYVLRGETVNAEMVGGEVPFPLVQKERFEAHFARVWERSEPYSPWTSPAPGPECTPGGPRVR